MATQRQIQQQATDWNNWINEYAQQQQQVQQQQGNLYGQQIAASPVALGAEIQAYNPNLQVSSNAGMINPLATAQTAQDFLGQVAGYSTPESVARNARAIQTR